MASTPAQEELELPEELIAVVEKKRLSNTIAARRSRARKQERLSELSDDNDRLSEENTALRARVALLEGVMRTMGLPLPL